MVAPDQAYVEGFIKGFDFLRRTGQMVAYPVHIDGVRCISIGRVQAAESGNPENRDVAPYLVIVNDELAAKMDLSEART